MPRSLAAVVIAGGVAIGLVIAASTVMTEAATEWARLELILAAAVALTGTLLSLRGTAGRVRRVRSWITLATAFWLTAELTRDAELLLGANPAISLAHLPFAGVLACAGLAYAAALDGQLSRREQLAVYLDGAIVFFTTAAVMLIAFGGAVGSSLQATFDLAYAIFFMATTGATLLLDLAVRAERRPSGAYAVLAGLVLMGLGFLWRVADPAGADTGVGFHVHLLASGLYVAMLGTATWTDAVDTDPGYLRLAAGLRTAIPLLAIATTPVLVAVQFVGHLPALIAILVRAAIALVLLSVALRQTVLLTDRERAVGRERELGRELARAEAKYRTLVEQQPGAIYLAEPGVRGRWHYVSPQIEPLLGLPAQAWLDDPTLWANRIHPDDRDRVLGAERELVTDRPSGLVQREYRMRAADGRDVWVLDDESVAERDDAGNPTLVQGLLLDITERKHVEQALRASEEQTRLIIDTASYAFIGMDTDGRVIDWNQAATETFGWQRAEAIGQSLAELIIPEAVRAAHTEGMRRFLATGEGPILGQRIEVEALHRDGRLFPAELTIWPIELDGEVRFNALVDDITLRKQLEDQLRHQALHDGLTGLPNRALFIDRLDHALERAKQVPGGAVAVLFIDLDDFKALNDSLGHQAADAVLIGLADRLRQALRTEDTLARLGGDEFAVLLEDVGDDVAQTTAIRLLRQIARPLELDGSTVLAHASIGIAVSGEHGTTSDELVRNADLAMYLAKGRGKNRYEEYERGMHESTLRRLALRQALEEAIAADALEVHYQPIVALDDGTVTGLEALLRWRGPDGQYASLPETIAIAEETGLILPIGRSVLEQACRDTRRWQETTGLDGALDIAVNVSVRQLEEGTLIEDVERALASSGLPASSLVLEITESALATDSLHSLRTIRGLRNLGVRLALDDFGTGYSSLERLRRFPVDIVKIDRSFVTAIANDREGVLVQSIIDLGRSLRMEVVAEGVETPAQLTALRARGATSGQGYYFAKPMPAAAVEVVLEFGRLPLPRRHGRRVVSSTDAAAR